MKKFTILLLLLICFIYQANAITLNANPTSNNGTGGIFTQLTTNANSITITSFNTMYGSAAGSSVTVQIYSRSGAYAGFTESSAGWTLVGTITTTSAGTETVAPLDVTSLNINLLPSTTTSFYLHSISVGGGIRYFGTGTTTMTNFNDANLALFTDVGRTGSVAFGGTEFSFRALTGSIDYVISGSTEPPCATITPMACGSSVTTVTSGSGLWSPGNCGFSTPGQEKVYSFTPTTTGTFVLQITAATGGFADYYFKLASEGCSVTGWTCIGDANAPESNNFGPLTAGVQYYILVDPEVTISASQTFQINCPAADPCLIITSIYCESPVTHTFLGSGIWNPLSCGFSTPGQEKIYSFIPTISGLHQLQVTSSAGGFIDYFYKDASGVCSATGWTCIGDSNAPESNNFGPLTAGVQYYILVDPEVTISASQTFQINCPVLPPGWSQSPNGVDCTDGNNIEFNPTTEVWTATSTNCYYISPFNSDETAFAQRTLCGNGSLTAEVTGISGTALGWAGIVMRESNAPGAKKVQVMTNLSNLLRREVRTLTNGPAMPQQFPSQNRFWLRLVRTGNQIAAFHSNNGVNWFLVMNVNVPMNTCIEMGLVVTNYSSNSTVTATFDNVAFTGAGPLPISSMQGNGIIASEELYQHDFNVYPNPTSGELNLNLKDYFGRKAQIEIYSLEGKLIQLIQLDEIDQSTQTIQMDTFSAGLYIVKLKSEGLPFVAKRILLIKS